jgi:hypothetical protein
MDISPDTLNDNEWRSVIHYYFFAIEGNKSLSRKELIYLYETKFKDNNRKEDFKALREKRNIKADLPIIFECDPSQVIYNEKELKEATKNKTEIKAYVGELFSNIFKVLPSSLEHIYTEYPEGIIRQKTIKLGTGLKTKDEFINAIEQQGGGVANWAKGIMSQPEFVVSNKETKENLIILSVKSLGFASGATVKEIFERAKKLGLELCPPETGPQLRLQYKEQPIDEWCLIGMEPIAGFDGDPCLFDVYLNGGKLWLHTSDGRPDYRYDSTFHVSFVRASKT